MLQDIKSTNKSVAYLYTNHETSEKDKDKRPVHNSIKTNNIFRNKYNQVNERHVPQNYKTLLKTIKGDTNTWKDISC